MWIKDQSIPKSAAYRTKVLWFHCIAKFCKRLTSDIKGEVIHLKWAFFQKQYYCQCFFLDGGVSNQVL